MSESTSKYCDQCGRKITENDPYDEVVCRRKYLGDEHIAPEQHKWTLCAEHGEELYYKTSNRIGSPGFTD